jgi:hypothetical protein
MTLKRFLAQHAPRKAEICDETITVRDIAPALDGDHIKVTLDGQPVGAESLQWYYEIYVSQKTSERECSPVCLLQVGRPALDAGGHEVRVAVSDRDTGHAGEVVTCFRSNEAGFGFRG